MYNRRAICDQSLKLLHHLKTTLSDLYRYGCTVMVHTNLTNLLLEQQLNVSVARNLNVSLLVCHTCYNGTKALNFFRIFRLWTLGLLKDFGL